MRHRDDGAGEAGAGGERGAVELDEVGAKLSRQRRDRRTGGAHRPRPVGEPVERHAGVDHPDTIGHRLALVGRGRRPQHRQHRLEPVRDQSGGQLGRVLPDAADRVGGHQQLHAAMSSAGSGRLSRRSSASQRASAATPLFQSRLPVRPNAAAAARVSATK